MSNLKISQLTAGTAQNADLIPIARSGQNFAVPASTVGALAPTVTLPTFQSNSVSNAVQSLLNIIAGSNMSVSSDAFGGVTLNANLPGFTTAGSGLAWSFDTFLQFGGSFGGGMSFGQGSAASNNNSIVAILLQLTNPFTFREVSMQMGSLNGGKVCFAIYDFTGTTKLLDAGTNAFDGGTSGIQTVTLGTPVTLQPGSYWCGSGQTAANSSGAGWAPGGSGAWNNIGGNRVVNAQNSISAGAMPASLGTLTARVASSVPGVLLTT